MTFPAWGMDGATATTLTGSTIADADLDAAEEEIIDYLGWRPDPDNYGDPDPANAGTVIGHDVRARAYGRAVAWQAAYRADVAAAATDGPNGIVSETIGEYSYQRMPGTGGTAQVVARARTILVRAGFTARGRSSITVP